MDIMVVLAVVVTALLLGPAVAVGAVLDCRRQRRVLAELRACAEASTRRAQAAADAERWELAATEEELRYSSSVAAQRYAALQVAYRDLAAAKRDIAAWRAASAAANDAANAAEEAAAMWETRAREARALFNAAVEEKFALQGEVEELRKQLIHFVLTDEQLARR